MYGKPAPKGSGNGWSGWYKGTFFRSLLELSYIKYLFDKNIKFENGEKECHHIKYLDFKNSERTYMPDFYLVDSKEYIEIKPKKLINTPSNKLKFSAAKEKHGDKFKIITENEIEKLSLNQILSLKDLEFMEKYKKKLLEYGTNT